MEANRLFTGKVVKDKKNGLLYQIRASIARQYQTDGSYIDCIVYRPLFNCSYNMFSSPVEDFISKFEEYDTRK